MFSLNENQKAAIFILPHDQNHANIYKRNMTLKYQGKNGMNPQIALQFIQQVNFTPTGIYSSLVSGIVPKLGMTFMEIVGRRQMVILDKIVVFLYFRRCFSVYLHDFWQNGNKHLCDIKFLLHKKDKVRSWLKS